MSSAVLGILIAIPVTILSDATENLHERAFIAYRQPYTVHMFMYQLYRLFSFTAYMHVSIIQTCLIVRCG